MTIQQNETTTEVTTDNAVIGETLYFKDGEPHEGRELVVTSVQWSMFGHETLIYGDLQGEDGFNSGWYARRFERRPVAPAPFAGVTEEVTIDNAVPGETVYFKAEQDGVKNYHVGKAFKVRHVNAQRHLKTLSGYVEGEDRTISFWASRFERRKPIEVTLDNAEVGEILTLDPKTRALNAKKGDLARVTGTQAPSILVEWLQQTSQMDGDYNPKDFQRLALELPDLDAELGKEIFVLDKQALRDLPAGTIVKDRDGDHYIRTEEGAVYEWADYDVLDEDYDADGDEGSGYVIYYQPVQVVNPEILGEFVEPKPEPKFAVGDRVKVTSSPFGQHHLQAGAIGTIDSVGSEDKRGDYLVIVDHEWDTHGWGFEEGELEAYFDAKFKAGDRVVITADVYEGHESRAKGGVGTVTERYGNRRNPETYGVIVDNSPEEDKDFAWSFFDHQLELYVEPPFNVGDRVEVVGYNEDWDGFATVATVWGGGSVSVVSEAGTIAGRRGAFDLKYLRKAEPKPEPFEPLAYPTIATMEEARTLPDRSVLVIDEDFVVTKVGDEFRRVNRFSKGETYVYDGYLERRFERDLHALVVFAPGITN